MHSFPHGWHTGIGIRIDYPIIQPKQKGRDLKRVKLLISLLVLWVARIVVA